MSVVFDEWVQNNFSFSPHITKFSLCLFPECGYRFQNFSLSLWKKLSLNHAANLFVDKLKVFLIVLFGFKSSRKIALDQILLHCSEPLENESLIWMNDDFLFILTPLFPRLFQY